MARPRFPSDDKRLRAPAHVRIDLTFRRHPRTSGLTLEQRGILWSLWFVVREARSGGEVAIARDDLSWITGRQDQRHALRPFLEVCELMDYRVRARCVHGDRVVRALGASSADAASVRCAHSECAWSVILVGVRNYEQKQGFGSAVPPSDARSETETETATERETSAAESLSHGHEDRNPESRGQEEERTEATGPPVQLSDVQRARLADRVKSSAAWALGDLLRLENATLANARAKRLRRMDWVEEVLLWILREHDRTPRSRPASRPPIGPRPLSSEDQAGRDELARRREDHRQKLFEGEAMAPRTTGRRQPESGAS